MLIIPIQCFAEGVTVEEIKEAEKFTPDKCYEYLFSMPALLPIANKMGFPDLKKASFEQLANTAKATDQEKPLIAKYAEGAKICHELDMDMQPNNLHQKIKAALYENESNRTSSLIDLYNQKISYGEYIKMRKESNAKLTNEIDIADREIDEYKQNAVAYEKAQKQQAISDTLGNISNSIRNSRPPRAVNCNPNGIGGIRCQ